jgi:ABC-2 type transport system permease protein
MAITSMKPEQANNTESPYDSGRKKAEPGRGLAGYASLYLSLQWANLRSRMIYPVNFITGTASIAVICAVDLVLTWVLTQRVPLIGGWGFYEMVFLLSIWRLTHGLFIVVFQQISDIDYLIREGEFDRYLARPLPPLFQYFTRAFQIGGLGDLAVGAGGLLLALPHIGHWSALQLLPLLVMIISAAAIEWAVFTIIGCTSFWTLQSQGLRSIFDTFLYQFSKFPLTAYSKWIQALLTFALPVGFISFYPSLLFLHGQQSVPFHTSLIYAPPLLAVLLCAAAYRFWKRGLNEYKGAGS